MTSLYVALYMFGLDLKDRVRREDRGASAVEYGLLVGLIAVVIIVAVTAFGSKISGIFTDVNSKL